MLRSRCDKRQVCVMRPPTNTDEDSAGNAGKDEIKDKACNYVLENALSLMQDVDTDRIGHTAKSP